MERSVNHEQQLLEKARDRSAVIGIAVHSAQSVVFSALVLALVLKG